MSNALLRIRARYRVWRAKRTQGWVSIEDALLGGIPEEVIRQAQMYTDQVIFGDPCYTVKRLRYESTKVVPPFKPFPPDDVMREMYHPRHHPPE